MCPHDGAVIGSIRTEYEMTFLISQPDRWPLIFWKYRHFVKRQRLTVVCQDPFSGHSGDVLACRNTLTATQSSNDERNTDRNNRSGRDVWSAHVLLCLGAKTVLAFSIDQRSQTIENAPGECKQRKPGIRSTLAPFVQSFLCN